MELKRNLLRAVCKIKGENLNYLPEFAHQKGVAVLDFSLNGEKECFITVDFSEISKIFAICKNMCYNITIVKYKGVLSPLALLIKNASLVIGCALFVLFTVILNGLVLDVTVVGSGSCFSNETKAVIADLGIKKFTAFKDINYNEVATEILKSNSRLSFVTASKRGNRLVIDAVLSTTPPKALGQDSKDLISSVNGTVEEISVLRGTAIVKVGDIVKVNDLLVGAYLIGKDEKIFPTYVVARVKILENKEYFYKCSEITEQAVSIAYALSEFYIDGEVANKTHQVVDGGVLVKTQIRRVIYGG